LPLALNGQFYRRSECKSVNRDPRYAVTLKKEDICAKELLLVQKKVPAPIPVIKFWRSIPQVHFISSNPVVLEDWQFGVVKVNIQIALVHAMAVGGKNRDNSTNF